MLPLMWLLSFAAAAALHSSVILSNQTNTNTVGENMCGWRDDGVLLVSMNAIFEIRCLVCLQTCRW